MLTAKSLSVFVCKHGAVFIRLHDADGNIFAVGGMDPDTADAFLEDCRSALAERAGDCDGPDSDLAMTRAVGSA